MNKKVSLSLYGNNTVWRLDVYDDVAERVLSDFKAGKVFSIVERNFRQEVVKEHVFNPNMLTNVTVRVLER